MITKKDFFNEIKEELVRLDIKCISKMLDIINLVNSYPWVLNHVHLSESFTKLIDIDRLNTTSFKDVVIYFNELEENNKFFLKEDIINIYDLLKENIELEDTFYINMCDYILILEEFILDNLDKRLNEFKENDTDIFNQIKENNKQLKKELKKGDVDFE